MIIIIKSNILRSLLRWTDKLYLKKKIITVLINNYFIREIKGNKWVVCELIERVNKLDQVRSTGPKPEREEHIFSKWIISQGDPAVEINHFEGSGPKWLAHKNTFRFRQRARFWEGERESTYWCMLAVLTLYLFFSPSFLIFPFFLSFFLFLILISISWFSSFQHRSACCCCYVIVSLFLYTTRASL